MPSYIKAIIIAPTIFWISYLSFLLYLLLCHCFYLLLCLFIALFSSFSLYSLAYRELLLYAIASIIIHQYFSFLYLWLLPVTFLWILLFPLPIAIDCLFITDIALSFTHCSCISLYKFSFAYCYWSNILPIFIVLTFINCFYLHWLLFNLYIFVLLFPICIYCY